MGLEKLYARLTDEVHRDKFTGLLNRDNPKNIRFSINYFTSIGLGALTEELREYLANAEKLVLNQRALANKEDSDSDESSSESSDSDSESSSSSSSYSESSSSRTEKLKKK
jgi:pre-mRNA-splicing factor CWC22